MLLMDGVVRCTNIIRSPSPNGTREVYYIYLNKTSRFASSGTYKTWFPTVVSHVGSLVSDRVVELISRPGSGMGGGRVMGRSANLSISSLKSLLQRNSSDMSLLPSNLIAGQWLYETIMQCLWPS